MGEQRSPMHCYISIAIVMNHMFWHLCYPDLGFPRDMRGIFSVHSKIWEGSDMHGCMNISALV